eukprot:Nk52_evm7s2531 gene=Nk52_evmTU7s2531
MTNFVDSSGYFSVLPDEILAHILSFTTSRPRQADVFVRGLLCKRFTHVINNSRALERKYLEEIFLRRLERVYDVHRMYANGMGESYRLINSKKAKEDYFSYPNVEYAREYEDVQEAEYSITSLLTKHIDFEDGLFLLKV